MALIGNGVRLSSSNPMRQSGAVNLGTQIAERERQPGSMRSIYVSAAYNQSTRAYASIPNGYYPPYTWLLAPKAGSIKLTHSAAAVQTVFAVPVVAGEVTMNASASLVQLGVIVASASVAMTAAASLVQSGSAVARGAVNMTAAATNTISGAALARGTVNMNATATLAVSTTGVGSMTVDMQPYSELSPESLAAAIWESLAVNHNTAGTMGEKLNDAGSAGDPWATNLSGYTDPATFGGRFQKLLTIAKFLGLK